ncbi:outer membrane lipoprotein LolB [Shewanella sp. Choline-02u-19]|jgi:outer membrane lipoprotein LolB|nr:MULTISPECIES: lipoprotein insertase outer membrane protein LolB [unclassified Shewanella]PKG75170.1 outer membrane lipoprotein LolB [Shewanella sp. GutCb]PKH58435.1 outer membrane lipoprotein LolB [Shewanella sp. Bg11-22]PKI26508.1 outer membrane lipoprotein LolB [Shewanella sp. Choline-02u-19]
MNNLSSFTKNTYAWVILSFIFISGCSTTIPDNLVPVSVDQVEQAHAWEMQGKLAVRTADDKFSTNLYWLHTPFSNELKLTTMLGTTVLSLTSTMGNTILELDGKTYTDTDAQRLLTRITGWTIPIDALPLWITGQLSSGDEIISQDALNRPLSLVNATQPPPWKVDFKSWQTQSGAELPRLLDLKRDDIQLKIQINQWQALAAEDAPATNRSQPNSSEPSL